MSTRKSARLHSHSAPQNPPRTNRPRISVKNTGVLKRELSSPDTPFADISPPILQSPSLEDVEIRGKSNSNSICDEQSTSTNFMQSDSNTFGVNSHQSFHSDYPHNYIPPYPIMGNPMNQTPHIASYAQQIQQTIPDQLQSCIQNDSLDIYRAGKVIHEAYLRRHASIVEDCRIFALKNSKKIISFKMPPPTCYTDSNIHMVLLHGQLIYSMISKPSVPAVNIISTENEREYKKLRGAIFRTRHLKLYYPSVPPFSGLQMKLESVPMERKTLNQAHVVLKTYIFQLLSASCHVPTDIQNILWSLPHDNSYSTHTPFPPTLYNDMRGLRLALFPMSKQFL
ncbi:hypothetical protein B9Z55_020929 [Caenorhabditis nigoni]|nr:hypothetical protein B9Z55_020929 [Caenorhabditis nigoni]